MTDVYFANTVSKHGNEQVIGRYIKEQGKEYKLLNNPNYGLERGRYWSEIEGLVDFNW